MAAQYHLGQRLSLKSQLCTVRYIGPVDGKSGEWLGIEWDDATRGKHNGVHEGKKYFDCRGKSPACASFIRPNQPWDKPRSFLEALREKYVSLTDPSDQEMIYFSSKQAEEVGFDKFARRQAELRGIYVLVLDRICVRHRPEDPDVGAIEDVCREITELDISGNLFQTVREVHDLCRRLPKLRSVTLDGNRFSLDDMLDIPEGTFANIRTLSLSNVLLNWDAELVPLLQRHFPGLQTLTATNNQWSSARSADGLPTRLKVLDLSDNVFEALSDLTCVASSSVETLVLKNCHVSAIVSSTGSEDLGSTFTSVQELDVRHNNITNWTFFDHLLASFPSLRHLRTTGNPLYAHLKTHDGEPLTAEDGYMLTIARLPHLEQLNYSKITDKDRLNAEKYYFSLIAAELSGSSTGAEEADVRKRHPRFAGLCEKYGEPIISRKIPAKAGDVDPDSLAARLVRITFTADSASWTEEFPKSLSIYELLGLVGKRLGVMPLKLRLVLETGERDPLAKGREYEGPEWWCSDSEDEDEEGEDALASESEEAGWAMREVELVAGTRALGTYVEGGEARVRV